MRATTRARVAALVPRWVGCWAVTWGRRCRGRPVCWTLDVTEGADQRPARCAAGRCGSAARDAASPRRSRPRSGHERRGRSPGLASTWVWGTRAALYQQTRYQAGQAHRCGVRADRVYTRPGPGPAGTWMGASPCRGAQPPSTSIRPPARRRRRLRARRAWRAWRAPWTPRASTWSRCRGLVLCRIRGAARARGARGRWRTMPLECLSNAPRSRAADTCVHPLARRPVSGCGAGAAAGWKGHRPGVGSAGATVEHRAPGPSRPGHPVGRGR